MTTPSLCAHLSFTAISVGLLVISIAFAIPAETLPDWFSVSPYLIYNFGAFQVCSNSYNYYSTAVCQPFNCYSFYDYNSGLSFNKGSCGRLGASRALIMIGLILNFLSIAPIILLVFVRKPAYKLICRSTSIIPLTLSSISLLVPMGLIPSVSREVGGTLGVGYAFAVVSGGLTVIATVLFVSFTIYSIQLEKATPTSAMNTSLIESSYPSSTQYPPSQAHYAQPSYGQPSYGQSNYPRVNQYQPQAYNTFTSYPPQQHNYPQANSTHPQYAVVATPITHQQSASPYQENKSHPSQPITHMYQPQSPQPQPQSPQPQLQPQNPPHAAE